MIIEKFFPTIVYGKDVQLDNNQLEQSIIKWANEDKGIVKTNYKGWHSTTDMANKPEYQQLVKELLKMQEEIFDNEHLDRSSRLGNMWANINPPGGYNAPHIHPNSLYSGVYYIKAPKDSGDLVFNDPRPGEQLNMPAIKKGPPPKHLWREVHLAPVEGRIIIFPFYLWHNVEPNLSNDIRISVSFNFIQHGF